MKVTATRYIHITAVCGVLFLMAACNGGGGDTYDSPTSGTVSCPTYTVGDQFTYARTTTASGILTDASTQTNTVIDTNAGAANIQSTFSNNSDVHTYYHSSTPDTFELTKVEERDVNGVLLNTTTYDKPWTFCPPPNGGDQITSTVTYTDGTPDLRSITTFNYSSSIESITVPAGVFAATKISYSTNLSGETIDTTVWFDAEIGEIKSVNSISVTVAGLTVTSVNTSVLESFTKQ